jgi:uncharacterized membrane protein YagU involved in acid resistance
MTLGEFSMKSKTNLMTNMLRGAAAGLLATLPMTIFMQTAWLGLPARELHPLPPRQITRKILRQTGLHSRVNQRNERILTWLLHFLFGAAAGSIYGIADQKMPGDAPVKGLLAGTTLWTGSYLGWIPLLGILPPATRHPWRMNILMIVAHLIWGTALGMLANLWNPQKNIDF